MLILGEHSDDKGAQLETLTHHLLEFKGCIRVRTNEVGAGGHEIDVSADAPIPGLEHPPQMRRVICESKAHRNPMDMTQWLKFLGKVYVEESEGAQITGYFIALGGVNGPVAGNYRSLKARRPNVVMLDGEDLLALMTQLYPLCTLQEAEHTLRRFTNRSVREYEVAYYDRKLYRLVFFEDDTYTLLDQNGQPLPTDERLSKLSRMIEEAKAVKDYVDLPLEAEARRRTTCAQMAVVSQLMLDDGVTNMSRVLSQVAEFESFTLDELEQAKTALEQQGWVERDSIAAQDVEQIRFSVSTNPQENIARFVAALSFLVNPKLEGGCHGGLFLRVFGCPYYDAHINNDLVAYIQTVQADLPLTEEHSQKVLALCRLSPSALLRATHPDQNLVLHRREQISELTGEEKEEFDGWGRDYLLRTLYRDLMADFQRPYLRPYFYELRGLREIETVEKVRVKSEERIELEDALSERRAIIILADDYVSPDGGGKYAPAIPVRGNDPWDVDN